MIQVTLSANQFQWSGTYNNKAYTSLRIKHISKGRVYFVTVNDKGIKLSEMAKQIKLENGSAYISFGKQGNLVIGTYVDDTAISEEVSESTNEDVKPNQPKTSRQLVETITNDNYIIDVYTWLSHDNIQCYYIEVKDINTNQVIEELSDIVYLSREAAYKFINEVNPVQETKQPNPINETVKANKSNVINEQTKKLNMIANYGKILFKSDSVDVIFTNEKEENTITFKRKKSWSNKKYIDQSFKLYGVNPSWDFRYGWEYVTK